ncbi:MAG: alpha-glucosidase C-terminal domain-containing protein [Anaerolineae bacterium]|nr:alpha-glucosidase C-terminal domain-containing protein [Anaerolineae bacterium]
MINLETEARVTLQRLRPRIEPLLADADTLTNDDRAIFLDRLERLFPAIFRLMFDLYGQRYDFFYHLEQTLFTVVDLYAARPPELKALDRQREANPQWFQGEHMMGGVCYVDLFAGTLAGVREKIPYLKELGLTYLHLMPLFRAPDGENDGGYAISDYRNVNPALGSNGELIALAADLRENGISLVLDFVFNHTSNEHDWAQRALAGDEEYQAFYLMFDDRQLPDQYERTLREIFPEQAPGNFTYQPAINKWVWTTFREFQWDLNYANPRVFRAMLGEMLFLANIGTEVLRLDAVAFVWKQLGTMCEGLPQVHTVVRAYNAFVRLAAPSMLFKSEAIVHPAEVARYIHPDEAPLSYNPTLMALLWESLATRKVTLLRQSMIKRFTIPEGCTWVNYVRCHDDIGWTFADEDGWEVGINGYDHRQFLNTFYIGKFPGSFAKGLPFNYNPQTGDMRISGMCASLAGLEQAAETGSSLYREHALRRIELIHAVIISAGGIPLLYLGDEIALTNDYGYRQNPRRANDTRWAHRRAFDWDRAVLRRDAATTPGRVFQTLLHLIRIRKQTPAFANGQTEFFDTGNEHVLGYVRSRAILVLANFSEQQQTARVHWLPDNPVNLVSGEPVAPASAGSAALTLEPYQFVWLAPGKKTTGNKAT